MEQEDVMRNVRRQKTTFDRLRYSLHSSQAPNRRTSIIAFEPDGGSLLSPRESMLAPIEKVKGQTCGHGGVATDGHRFRPRRRAAQ